MKIDYTIKKTDPNNGQFVIKAYTANGPALPSVNIPLYPNAASANTSLVLLGKGLMQYGEPLINDLVHMLENFAGPTPPVYPIQGQTWYNNSSNSLLIYDGANWNVLSDGSGGGSGSYLPLYGGTLLGNLTISPPYNIISSAIPITNNDLTNKLYVDTAISTAIASINISPSSTSGVTSVGLTLPTIFNVTHPTVTSSGNLTATLQSQLPNLVFASPNGGGGIPSFRSLVAADIPTLNQNTTGTANNVTGVVAIANGGTGKTIASDALTALGGYPLTNPSGYITSLGNAATATAIAGGSTNKLIYQTGPSATGFVALPTSANTYLMWNGTSYTWGTGSTGTGIGSTGISSIGLSLPNIFAVSNSPLTTNGTLTATLNNQSQSNVLIAPSTSSGIPSFRSLIAADIPILNQTTTGTAANVTGVVAIANGGTGQITQQLAINALSGAQSSGTFLRSDGTNVTLSKITAADVPILNQNTTGTAAGITGGTANQSQLLYQSGVNTTRLVTYPSTPNTYLMWDGQYYTWGTVSATHTLASIASIPTIASNDDWVITGTLTSPDNKTIKLSGVYQTWSYDTITNTYKISPNTSGTTSVYTTEHLISFKGGSTEVDYWSTLYTDVSWWNNGLFNWTIIVCLRVLSNGTVTGTLLQKNTPTVNNVGSYTNNASIATAMASSTTKTPYIKFIGLYLDEIK